MLKASTKLQLQVIAWGAPNAGGTPEEEINDVIKVWEPGGRLCS